MQKINAKGQSVRKMQWKQSTDGQTDGGDSITFRVNAVGKYDVPVCRFWFILTTIKNLVLADD